MRTAIFPAVRVLRIVLSVALLICCGGRLSHASEAEKLWGDYEMPSAREEGGLIAPGQDTDKVVSFLRRILEHQIAHQDALRNVRMRGRVSRVSAICGPRDRSTVDPHRFDADWCDFMYLKVGTQQRYEQDYVNSIGSQRKKERIFRLADGADFYRLNVNGLDIESWPTREDTWPTETIDFSIYELVDDGRGLQTLTVTLTHLIDRLCRPSHDDYFKKRNRFVRCYEENNLLVVDDACGPNTPELKRGSRFTFWIDPAKGYRVVASRSQSGAPGRGIFSTTESKNTFREHAPGVFVLSTGECILGHFGEPKNQQPQTGWTRCNLEVRDVAVGDFECDSNMFSADLLPIPLGTPVTDYRKKPPTSLLFGNERLSDQLRSQNSAPK